jgi:xylan 1,4-beta-xylosidase
MTTQIHLDFDAPATPYQPFWKKLTTAGRAAEGLREDWRQHLREVQREIGFEYIRFHGVLHDDMMVYHEDEHGAPYYNWQYFDSLLDFLRSVGLRPILELGFMPSALKSGEHTIFWWKGNITPPRDYGKWAGLVRALVAHCIERYGLEEVLRWYFEVWNEANLHMIFWSSDQAEYFKLYESTARAIKSVNEQLKVGGPASSNHENGKAPWVEDFIAFCAREDVPLDFISTHPYPNNWPLDSSGNTLMCYRDIHAAREDLRWIRQTVDASPFPRAEIHLTEWNSSPSPRDLVHDTAFIAPFIIQSHIESIGLVDSLGFWTFTDVFEEGAAGDTVFHGGFGLINFLGLKKSSYFGYWYLARLGNQMVAYGENYAVTRQGEKLQILLWNHCPYTSAFTNGDRSALSLSERYAIFDEKESCFTLRVEGLPSGYKVTRHLLDRQHGAAFDVWLANGKLESPSAEELAILQRLTAPHASIERRAGSSAFEQDVTLQPHGVLLIEIAPCATDPG